MKCTHCGWKNPATVTFCRKCGARLSDTSTSSTTLSSRELTAVRRSGVLTNNSGVLNSNSGVLTSNYSEYNEYPADARRRRIRPLIWLLLALLLLGGGGLAWWIISANQPANGVMTTLQTYCNGLESANYHLAYQQWSSNTQMSESDFTYTQNSKPKTTGCTVNNISVSGATAQASLTFVYINGSSVVDQINLVLENGNWKIKSQSLS